jgi:RHS repeat-associated protein
VMSTYDWAGRLVTHAGQPCTHDVAGNLTSCGTALDGRTLRYDTSNLVASVASAQGEVRYRYDGDGSLVERTVNGHTTVYVPTPLAAHWRPLLATDDTGTSTAFVWDGTTVLASITGEEVRFFLHDHLGSVRGVVDQAGKLMALVDYSPFGQPHQPAQTRQVFPGFAGLFFDPTAAVYLTHARAYDPALGRFLQMEPDVRVPYGSQNDLSPYVYGGNDPVELCRRVWARSCPSQPYGHRLDTKAPRHGAPSPGGDGTEAHRPARHQRASPDR